MAGKCCQKGMLKLRPKRMFQVSKVSKNNREAHVNAISMIKHTLHSKRFRTDDQSLMRNTSHCTLKKWFKTQKAYDHIL